MELLEYILANSLFYLVWITSLLLLYLLRRNEVEQLYADYMGAPALWMMLACSNLILWATWSLCQPLSIGAVWLYNENWPDVMAWLELDISSMVKLKEAVEWAIRLIIVLPPLGLVIKLTPWMSRGVLELTSRIDW